MVSEEDISKAKENALNTEFFFPALHYGGIITNANVSIIIASKGHSIYSVMKGPIDEHFSVFHSKREKKKKTVHFT